MNKYWKQFAGWATVLRGRYWSDPFFRSEFNVVALQFLFAGVLLLLVGFSFNYLSQDVSEVLIKGITESLKKGNQISSADIIDAVKSVRSQKFYGFIILTTVITFGFSYIIAKVTLSPARKALQSQKRFISDIAHELRTPLSIIKTESEVALMDENLGEDSRKPFESIIEELDRTSEIINNLLSFNNMIRPEKMAFDKVDMGKIVDICVGKLKTLAEQKEIDVRIKKVHPTVVWGNATALEQVVLNLLKNALNYTPSEGKVFVSVIPDYFGNTILTVEDTGMGIAKKDLEHIFEPFYRAERSRNRATGSSGLGLTIVSELVRIHSGRIAIRSTLNKGTTVVVSLPTDSS